MRARAGAFQRRGEERFFNADIEGSIKDFDAFLEIVPQQDPHHWQRGLSYYYAEEYEKGKAQFERHQTVNTQDVEKRPSGIFSAQFGLPVAAWRQPARSLFPSNMIPGCQ